MLSSVLLRRKRKLPSKEASCLRIRIEIDHPIPQITETAFEARLSPKAALTRVFARLSIEFDNGPFCGKDPNLFVVRCSREDYERIIRPGKTSEFDVVFTIIGNYRRHGRASVIRVGGGSQLAA